MFPIKIQIKLHFVMKSTQTHKTMIISCEKWCPIKWRYLGLFMINIIKGNTTPKENKGQTKINKHHRETRNWSSLWTGGEFKWSWKLNSSIETCHPSCSQARLVWKLHLGEEEFRLMRYFLNSKLSVLHMKGINVFPKCSFCFQDKYHSNIRI